MSESRVFGLDFLRAIAILLVLVAHASFMFLPLTHDLQPWWMLGHLGVELFFVLSGFLIGGILARQAQSADFNIGRFWIRRWLRTLPNYYLFLILNIAIARWIDAAWPPAAPYALFLQNLAWQQPIFFIESWSLSVEEIFYLLAPLLVLLFSWRPLRRIPAAALVVAAIVIATCVRVIYVKALDPGWDLSVRMVTLVRMDAIAYGVLVMLWFRNPAGIVRRFSGVIAAAGTIGIAVAAYLFLTLPKDTDFFARTGLFSLISASFAMFLPAAANWLRSGMPAPIDRTIRAIARWSYALYLCQLAVMRVMNQLGTGNAQSAAGCLIQAAMFMTVSIAIAALVYRWYEQPFLRLRDRWTRPATALAAGRSA